MYRVLSAPMVALLAVPCFPQAASETQGPKKALAAVENQSYRAELVSHADRPDFQSTVRVTDKQSGAQATLKADIRTGQVEDFRLVGDNRLLLLGKRPRGGYAYALISLAESRVEASFWAVDHACSPDGRFLLLVSEPPKIDPPGGPALLLYDFAAPKEANYLAGAPGPNIGEAGLPVYPPWNFANRDYATIFTPRHSYASPFLWSPDSKRVVFVSLDADQQQFFLVETGPLDSYQDIRVLREPLPLKDLAQSEERIPLSVALKVRELRWKDSRRVEARTGSSRPSAQQQLRPRISACQTNSADSRKAAKSRRTQSEERKRLIG